MNILLFDEFTTIPIIFFSIFGVIFVTAFVFVIISIVKGLKNKGEIEKNIGDIIKSKFNGKVKADKKDVCEYCGRIVDETGKCPNCGARKS